MPDLLPTSVVGSHALPGWFWTALDAIKEGKYGQTDVREVMDDAVNAALRDQERAGIDVVTDGEMRRWYFVQGFYSRITGLEELPPLRATGVYGYDSPPRYRLREKITIPDGLGIVDEYRYVVRQTEHEIKTTCPGPLTLTIHMQARPGDAYDGDRMALAYDCAGAINRELHALADAGARWIQLDEPSYSIIPGQAADWIALYNTAVRGVRQRGVRLGLHVCFGNLSSRPRGRRHYDWMFPAVLEAEADEIVLEFANREMIETELLAQIVGAGKRAVAGVVDVKSFYVEPPEEVAQRVRECLRHVPPDQLSLVPDCGFFQLPRWLCALKLRNLAAGVAQVRHEVAG